jgi:flagellin-like hook-associated protein FlgL
MRLTMQSIHSDILRNLNKITTDMARVNSQISSGKQMSKISDDPVNLVTALGVRTNLTQITSYQSNLNFGNSMITAAETALNGMKEMAIRGKELAIQMANGTMTQENRTSAAMEVSHLWEEAIFLANSQVAGKYVFGGYRTAGYSEAEPTPFIADKADGYIVNGNSLTPLLAAAPVAYNLTAGDLTINGVAIGATTGLDTLSTAHADASAAAKKAAINAKQDETGVTADFTAASVTAAAAVTDPLAPLGSTITSNDLVINGENIFDLVSYPAGATVFGNDSDNTLVDAINAKSDLTGVIASRSNGVLTLTAIDGRNIQVTTTVNGEAISRLNGAAANKVYFGTVQLKSDLPITLQSSINAGPPITEPGLVALGLDGGSAATNETNDVAGDGRLMVTTIQQRQGSVRYAGDRDNNIAVKVGATSSLEVTKNGMDAIMDTGVFSALKGLENALRGEKYTTVTGTKEATSTTATLDSGSTGLAQDGLAFANGTLSFAVTDQSYYPPRTKTINLEVDITQDTPATIAARISEIPGMTASWSTDGHLTVESSDPERYTFNYTDASNFMAMNGITQDALQFQAIQKSIGELGTLLDNLSNQVSDFGARANRIEVQSSLYLNLELAAKENLSGKEDTDMLKAIMELNGKKTAYEAALSAAAQTMQLSLVNFLR